MSWDWCGFSESLNALPLFGHWFRICPRIKSFILETNAMSVCNHDEVTIFLFCNIFLCSIKNPSIILLVVRHFIVNHYVVNCSHPSFVFPSIFLCQAWTVQKSAKPANPGLWWRWNGRSSAPKWSLYSYASLMTALERGACHVKLSSFLYKFSKDGQKVPSRKVSVQCLFEGKTSS